MPAIRFQHQHSGKQTIEGCFFGQRPVIAEKGAEHLSIALKKTNDSINSPLLFEGLKMPKILFRLIARRPQFHIRNYAITSDQNRGICARLAQ